MDENTLVHRILDLLQYKKEYQLNSSGIRTKEMYVLERIYLNGRTTPKYLSDTYHISSSTLTGIMDKLENRKLIARTRTENDRRSTWIDVTDKGKQVVKMHISEDELFARNLFSTLDEEKRNILKQLLQEMLDGVCLEELFIAKEQ